MLTWNRAILAVMQTTPNKGWRLHEIYTGVGSHPVVTARHLQPWRSGGQPRYECWVRRCLTNLVSAGVVDRIRPAVYRLH